MLKKLQRNFIGEAEVTKDSHHIKMNQKSRIMVAYGIITDIINKTIRVCDNLMSNLNENQRSHNNFIFKLLQKVEIKAENFLNKLNKTRICKHRLCNHRYNCLVYPILVNFEH